MAVGDELMRVDEACEYLKQGRSWFYRRVRAGELGIVKNGRSTRVTRADLDALIERNRRPPQCELDEEARKRLHDMVAQKLVNKVYGTSGRNAREIDHVGGALPGRGPTCAEVPPPSGSAGPNFDRGKKY